MPRRPPPTRAVGTASWANAQPSVSRRGGPGYRAAVEAAKHRAAAGEPCWFHGRPGHGLCPGRVDVTLDHHDRWSFTMHHLDRIMDDGPMVPDRSRTAPAHRRCNSADGLRAQNLRRAGRPTTEAVVYRSRRW